MTSALKICPQCGTEYPANERFCPRDGTALRSQSGDTDLVGSVIAERYHIMKKLGEGGMGQVYLAEHVKMGRKSAVKVMNPGMVKDVDAIARFNREAANASRINHPNVCGIYDFGETPEGIIYLAMEFIEGQSLTSLIASQGALPPMRAAEITRQTAEALGVAHDMGIVHRDLKPDNIMIARTRDGGDLVKVVDFGIAKATGNESQKVTKTGLVVGTPEFMSPEQLAGDPLDGRSDLYSLALVSFNMFTGRLPFPGETSQETMIMRLTDHPKTLAEMKPDVAWPADVQVAFDKALARNASDRFQTAPEFGRALFTAVERMPHSQATQAGTHIVGAVATPKNAPTVAAAIPATRVATPTDVMGATKSPAAPASVSKSKTPVYVGIAAVVLALAGGAWFMSRPKSPTVTQQVASTTDSTKSSAKPDSVPVKQAGKEADLMSKKAGSSGTSASPTGGSIVSPAKRLAILDTLTLTDANAPGVITEISGLSLTTEDMKAEASFVRFRAYVQTGDLQKACLNIDDAIKRTSDAGEKSRYQGRKDQICQ